MNGHLRFSVLGHPEPAGSKKALQLPHQRRPYVVDANPKAKDWKKKVAQSAGAAMLQSRMALIEGPLYVEMVFTRERPLSHLTQKGLSAEGRRTPFPMTKPDVLKLARGVEDACTGIVWRDDARIVKEVLRKEWGDVEGVTVTVEELDTEESEEAETGYHIIENHKVCYMLDRPHDDPTGCVTCHATGPSDLARCFYWQGMVDEARARRQS